MAHAGHERPEEDAIVQKVAAGLKLVGDEQDVYAAYIDRMRSEGRSDFSRWSSDAVFPEGWNARTAALAAMLPKGVHSVVDFGCGAMALRSSLPEALTYIPVDLVPRGDDTIVLDLNAHPLPLLPEADAAFFSGVLEYVIDLPRLIRAVCAAFGVVACSYVAADSRPGTSRRRAGGWVNDLRLSQLLAEFEDQDFRLIRAESWGSHSLLLLRTIRP